MVSYAPLWETMKLKGETTYTLREKHGFSSATVRQLKANRHVSTHTLQRFCTLLNCKVEDVVEITPEPINKTTMPPKIG